MKLLRDLYITNRLFYALYLCINLFAVSFFFDSLFRVAQIALLVIVALFIADVMLLFTIKKTVKCRRKMARVLSLGDENQVELNINNRSNYPLSLRIIDELPEQLQIRDFSMKYKIPPLGKKKLSYQVKPSVRGSYEFGNSVIFISTLLKLAERRIVLKNSKKVPVYPSIIQMKKYELIPVSSISHFQGIKRIRKIGHSYEFEQIKQYVPGDDTRSINWKASGRVANLMVNQYEDERSQAVYSIIDKSRVMKMPFNGLSLLDHSINTSLALSNTILRKHDKAGLLTFSNKIDSFIKAEKSSKQLERILRSLYNEKENYTEADYQRLYINIRNFISGRSLIFLYTNFESVYSLQRVLPILRKIGKMHLLVVIYFTNTELKDFSRQSADTLLDIYQQTAAKNLLYEKDLIMQELNLHGIQAIKTKPEENTVNSINKYLELKARGYI